MTPNRLTTPGAERGHGDHVACSCVRATIRNTKPPARYAELHRWWTQPSRLPTLYLHGNDDGCMTPEFTPWVRDALPDGSDVAIVQSAGHFLQLEQPDTVARRILDFLGPTSS